MGSVCTDKMVASGVLGHETSSGFFNSCIFVYHKAFSLQRQDRLLGFRDAFVLVLKGKEGEERIISDLELVKRNQALELARIARDASLVSAVEPRNAASNKQGRRNQGIPVEMDQVREKPLSEPSIEPSQYDVSGLSGSDDIGIKGMRTRGGSYAASLISAGPVRVIGATPDPSFAPSIQDLSGFSMSDTNDIACFENRGSGAEALEELSFQNDSGVSSG
eukprot:887310_1